MKRNTFAAARLRVCANVFTQSRIHFDPCRGAPLAIVLIDQAQVPRCLRSEEIVDDSIFPPSPRRATHITVH